ncbi:MAG: metal-dependent hydrolase [Burkholderiaceae bacterium]|jgi:inner membrane protein|nr:metal-dependent hydrolase [Burkholderiaceae bacterium]
MPTIFTHLAVPVAATVALGSRRIPPGALAAGVLASIAPDFDGIAFHLGIAYGGMTGHRGFTHTVLFALLFGLLGGWLAPRWRMRRVAGYAWIMLCTLSHPLLDMMTNGGAGIALFWPLDSVHHFLAWRPIEVSPLSLKRLLSLRGVQVARSELRNVWAPLMAAGLLVWAARHRRGAQSKR